MKETSTIQRAMQQIHSSRTAMDRQTPIAFEAFLKQVAQQPAVLIRNVFQFFHDMVKAYVGAGVDEYPDDPESINYVDYDCTRLFVDGSDHPFLS